MATIRLLSVSSRGDLQPYLAVLLELQRRGHAVTLIGSVNFQDAAAGVGLPFVPLPGDFSVVLRSEAGLALMGGQPVRLIDDAWLRTLLDQAHAAVQGTDVLLVSPLCLWGYHLAEAVGCRLVVPAMAACADASTVPVIGW
ncbi:MAG: glycosyltransferase [Cyanobacteriota bacterium]|nr:glycosyltransferase [Cyanobacteriota bacterium]